jgi:parvulin-like peptidyl-prolyl isomerase
MKSSLPKSRWLKRNSQRSEWVFRILLFALCTLPITLSAQTLFTYGKHAVSKNEFLQAYNKNNTDSSVSRVSYSDYLELYLRFKLKVQAALDARMDTTATQIAELKSFRNQLSEGFLKEDASIDLLTDEAFQRSLKDIHLSQIFIAADKAAPTDEVNAAQEKINEAYKRLQNGESFDAVAADYQHGSLGYITAFVLPYSVETIAYSTPPGQYSIPFQTGAGFHILRNDGERPAVGRIRAAQILVAFPPDSTTEKNKLLAQRADSIYNALAAGANFAELAEKLSDDHLSYMTGGEIPEFGVGTYDTAFENAAFSLAHDGDISKPVKTTFGYHIIKRIQRAPVVEDPQNKEWRATIREKVMISDRMQVAQAMLVQNVQKKIEKDAGPADLANDSAVLSYYREHLENYEPGFAAQMKEFSDGNLLFTIMQQKVWDAASSDTNGLREYYNGHKDKYQWENSADALIITALNEEFTEKARADIKAHFDLWRQWADESNGMIQADSGRFELSQIPVVERTNFSEGLTTAPVINSQDSSRTFAYIIRLYPEKEPKKFEDAKGAVINDYQVYLEEQWIAALKKKYPVKINKKVFNSL